MSIKSYTSYYTSSSSAAGWRLFSQYWWVVLFMACVFSLYSHAINDKEYEIASLQSIVETLDLQKRDAIDHNYDLRLHESSRKDPEFIKLLLKQNLGLLEEGQTKVTFE